MTYLASIRSGRIALHLIAMIGDRAYQWHWAGICRELGDHGLFFRRRPNVVR
jgi:hypothetical protein